MVETFRIDFLQQNRQETSLSTHHVKDFTLKSLSRRQV